MLIEILVPVLDLSRLSISPQRKRKQSTRPKDLIPFKIFITYYTPKTPGDPWKMVKSPQPVNAAVARWKSGPHKLDGLEKAPCRGVFMCVSHKILLFHPLNLPILIGCK